MALAGRDGYMVSSHAMPVKELTSLLSKTQLLSPSSSTSFQYRSPTRVRPATLRVFQKSSESKTTTTTIWHVS